jgi:hypothetical protein
VLAILGTVFAQPFLACCDRDNLVNGSLKGETTCVAF